MKKLKVRFGFLFLLLLILSWCLPAVTAENLTGEANLINLTTTTSANPVKPFITIDSIGNHTIGEGFFIKGTTNLWTWDKSLDLEIGTADFNPAGFGSSFYSSNVSIQPGENGISTWSSDIIPSHWKIYTESPNFYPTPIFESANPGKYMVFVSSTNSLGPAIVTSQSFFMFSSESSLLQNQTSTTTTISAVIVPPTKQDTPLPLAMPIAVLAAIMILKPLYGKKT
jgi:hypothetical protein